MKGEGGTPWRSFLCSIVLVLYMETGLTSAVRSHRILKSKASHQPEENRIFIVDNLSPTSTQSTGAVMSALSVGSTQFEPTGPSTSLSQPPADIQQTVSLPAPAPAQQPPPPIEPSASSPPKERPLPQLPEPSPSVEALLPASLMPPPSTSEVSPQTFRLPASQNNLNPEAELALREELANKLAEEQRAQLLRDPTLITAKKALEDAKLALLTEQEKYQRDQTQMDTLIGEEEREQRLQVDKEHAALLSLQQEAEHHLTELQAQHAEAHKRDEENSTLGFGDKLRSDQARKDLELELQSNFTTRVNELTAQFAAAESVRQSKMSQLQRTRADYTSKSEVLLKQLQGAVSDRTHAVNIAQQAVQAQLNALDAAHKSRSDTQTDRAHKVEELERRGCAETHWDHMWLPFNNEAELKPAGAGCVKLERGVSLLANSVDIQNVSMSGVARFDGFHQYVDLGPSEDLTLPLSLALWVKYSEKGLQESTVLKNLHCLLMLGNEGVEDELALCFNEGPYKNANIQLQIFGSNPLPLVGCNVVTPGLKPDVWVHVAVVFGTHTLGVFVNGEEILPSHFDDLLHIRSYRSQTATRVRNCPVNDWPPLAADGTRSLSSLWPHKLRGFNYLGRAWWKVPHGLGDNKAAFQERGAYFKGDIADFRIAANTEWTAVDVQNMMREGQP